MSTARRALAFVLAPAFALGCGFDSQSLGGGVDPADPDDGGEPSTSTSAAPAETSEPEPEPEDDDSTGVAASTGVGSVDTTGTDDDGPSPSCDADPPYRVGLSSEDATLLGAMTLDDSPVPVGSYAFSALEGQGIVEFEFEVDCPDTYHVWGLVYDAERVPVVQTDNADSFEVIVDDGAPLRWEFGCQKVFDIPEWSFEKIATADALCTGTQEHAFELEPGLHTISFRNLEAGSKAPDSPGRVAALARIVVTDDASYVPNLTND